MFQHNTAALCPDNHLTITHPGIVYSSEESPTSCVLVRLGLGLSYVLIYSSLLVKLVFLISLNTGVYLPAMYQALLFFFCVLVQAVILVQWNILKELREICRLRHQTDLV